jgi:hypothetical protein
MDKRAIRRLETRVSLEGLSGGRKRSCEWRLYRIFRTNVTLQANGFSQSSASFPQSSAEKNFLVPGDSRGIDHNAHLP